MKKRFTPFPQSESIRWEKYNNKRSTIIQSKKPYAERMKEEMELEKKMQGEEKKEWQYQ